MYYAIAEKNHVAVTAGQATAEHAEKGKIVTRKKIIKN
jgi:hypothetical protein